MCYAVVDPPDFAGAKVDRFVAAVEQRAGQRLKRDLIAGVKFRRRALVYVRRNLSARWQLSDNAATKLHAVDAVN
jgi:hypothetical protein